VNQGKRTSDMASTATTAGQTGQTQPRPNRPPQKEHTSVRQITYLQAIREGFAAGMRRDNGSFIVGEGIAVRGGCFGHTKGLYEEFGAERVLDLPISEASFVGMCAAAAACGSRAVVDLMYLDFSTLVMDQLVNQATKFRYISGGQFTMPLTLSAVFGAQGSAGCHHSQSLYPWFVYAPGIKVVIPSTPYDVKGLLASAVVDDNPVVVLEHRALLGRKGDVPEEDYFLPIGEAAVLREGRDVTVLSSGLMVSHALQAAAMLAEKGVSAEVIDLRTIWPLDEKTIIESLKKTLKLVVVDEGHAPCGIGAEITALVQEKAFDYLDAPVARVHTAHVPIPFAPELERFVLPNAEKVVQAVLAMQTRW